MNVLKVFFEYHGKSFKGYWNQPFVNNKIQKNILMNVLKVFFESHGVCFKGFWYKPLPKQNIENKIFENKVITDKKNPFQNDYTESWEAISLGLTKLLKNKSKKMPFVLSVDAVWGAGKTTFTDMWGQTLINNGSLAIKFDAWKNDYIQDPLGTFIASLSQQLLSLNPGNEEVKLLRTYAIEVFKAFARFGAVTLMKYAKFDDSGATLVDDLKNINNKNANAIIKSYENTYSILYNFKSSLREVTKERTLFIFIDELDRCKPMFAVEIFEIMKHILDVENVCCILSTNITSLSKSVAKFYGYDKSDEARNYLDRIIDIQFSLPKPDVKKFINSNIDQLIKEYVIKDEEFFMEIAKICCLSIESLRTIEKYISDIEIFLNCNQLLKEASVPEIYYAPILFLLTSKRITDQAVQTNLLSTLSENIKFNWTYNKLFSITRYKDKLESSVSKLFDQIKDGYKPNDPSHPYHALKPLYDDIKKLYNSTDDFKIRDYVDHGKIAHCSLQLLNLNQYNKSDNSDSEN